MPGLVAFPPLRLCGILPGQGIVTDGTKFRAKSAGCAGSGRHRRGTLPGAGRCPACLQGSRRQPIRRTGAVFCPGRLLLLDGNLGGLSLGLFRPAGASVPGSAADRAVRRHHPAAAPALRGGRDRLRARPSHGAHGAGVAGRDRKSFHHRRKHFTQRRAPRPRRAP